MPMPPYSLGVIFIKLDYLMSEFSRIQSCNDLSGMNVFLDSLPKVVNIWLLHNLMFPYHSFPEQLKSRQNYQPLTYLQSGPC